MDYDGFWSPAKIITSIVLFFVVVIGGTVIYPVVANKWWAYTSASIGKSQETQQVNSAQNRIAQYDHFYDEYGTYQTDINNVSTSESALKAFDKEYTTVQITGDSTGNLEELQAQDQAAVTGSQQICVAAAEAFNQDSRKVVTGAQFKGVDLSKQVSVSACDK